VEVKNDGFTAMGHRHRVALVDFEHTDVQDTSALLVGLNDEVPVHGTFLPTWRCGRLFAFVRRCRVWGGNGGVFFVKSDPSVTPAGLNLLDGAVAVVGYVVGGQGRSVYFRLGVPRMDHRRRPSS